MALILVEEKFQGREIGKDGIETVAGSEKLTFKPFDVVVLSDTMQMLALRNARKVGVKLEVYDASKHNPLISAYLKRSEASLRGQDLAKKRELLRPYTAESITKMSKDDLEELSLKLNLFGDPEIASKVPKKALEDIILATWGLSRAKTEVRAASVAPDEDDEDLTVEKIHAMGLTDLLNMLKSKGFAKPTDTVRSLDGEEKVRKLACEKLIEG
jgi:hypothetical protein